MSTLQQPQEFDAAAMHQLLQDVEIAVRQAYEGGFDERTANKGLLVGPCRDAGHPNYEKWNSQYTPVTFSLSSAMLLALIDVTEQQFNHGPDEARFISALASELTAFFSTLVVPAQRSDKRTLIMAPGGRQFVAFKFSLIDEPSSLPAWY